MTNEEEAYIGYKIKELEEEINNLKKEKKNLKRKYTILEKEKNNGTN